jgi:hypothetical protein
VPIGSESGSKDLYEVKEAFSYGYEWETDKNKFDYPL